MMKKQKKERCGHQGVAFCICLCWETFFKINHLVDQHQDALCPRG